MPTLLGRFKVPQWDAKSEGDARFDDAGVPTTYLLTPFHWEAWVFGLGAPQPGPDGVLTATMPLGEALLPGIAAEDIGRCAYAVFRGGEEFLGKTIGIAGEHVTGERLAAGLARVWDEPVRYQSLPLEVFRSLPFPGIEVAANMFQYVAEVNDDYCRLRDVRLARRLNPSLLGFDAWVSRTGHPPGSARCRHGAARADLLDHQRGRGRPMPARRGGTRRRRPHPGPPRPRE